MTRPGTRARLVGPLPATGPWTAVGLARGQFFAVLLTSLALFVWVDGPVWRHVRDTHFARIMVSYAVIPLGVAVALAWNRALGWRRLLGGTLVIGVTKLVVTAVLLAVLGMAGR
jgi:hypothetical protein